MAREHKWPHGSPQARSSDERALGAARDKIIRNNSVYNDTLLDLPVSIQRLDEEERPRRSPYLPPSGYDSRSEIQRPYIKPPPNKTVCCIPDPEGNKRGSGPSCSSCGPAGTTTHHRSSQQKNPSSATGNSSGWALSWSRGNKSPPSSHNRHHRQQHQRHVQSSTNNPSTCHPWSSSSSAPCSGVNVKQKTGALVPPVGVISSFLAGVITSSSEKGNGSQQFKDSSSVINSVKSINHVVGSYDPDLAKFRCLSERKPVNNDRTSPSSNVNSSVCSSGETTTTRQIGDAVLNANYSRTFKFDDEETESSSHPPTTGSAQCMKSAGPSSPSTTATHQYPNTTQSLESYSYSADNFAIFANAENDDRQRCKKVDRKSRHQKRTQDSTQPPTPSNFATEDAYACDGHGLGDKNSNMNRHNYDAKDGLPRNNHDYESNYNSNKGWTLFDTTPSSIIDHQQLLHSHSTEPRHDVNSRNSTLSWSGGESSIQEQTGQYYCSPSEPEPSTTNHRLTKNTSKYCTTATTSPEISDSIEPTSQHTNDVKNSGRHLK